MTPQEFLATLAPHADAPLVFDTGRGRVPGGYHVTEVKAVQVRSMDCGGRANAWNETVVQVWPPARPEATSMSVAKFLSIYERVAAAVQVDGSSHLRVEYGAPGEPALAYLVAGVSVEQGEVQVRLDLPAVACKGRDRSVGDLPVLPVAAGDGERAATAAGRPRPTPGADEGAGPCCGTAPTAAAKSDGAVACCT